MTFSLGIEVLLSALLMATLVYCAILERRLSALRRGQDGVRQTIGELDAAIKTAAQSIAELKSSAAQSAGLLDERLLRARALADELSLLTASGERIAARLASPGAAIPRPEILASRLKALKPEALRPESLRPESLRPESLRPESLRPEFLRPESLRPESLRDVR